MHITNMQWSRYLIILTEIERVIWQTRTSSRSCLEQVSLVFPFTHSRETKDNLQRQQRILRTGSEQVNMWVSKSYVYSQDRPENDNKRFS